MIPYSAIPYELSGGTIYNINSLNIPVATLRGIVSSTGDRYYWLSAKTVIGRAVIDYLNVKYPTLDYIKYNVIENIVLNFGFEGYPLPIPTVENPIPNYYEYYPAITDDIFNSFLRSEYFTVYNLTDIKQDAGSISPLTEYTEGLMESYNVWKTGLSTYGPNREKGQYEVCAGYISKIAAMKINEGTKAELLTKQDLFEIYLYELKIKRDEQLKQLNYGANNSQAIATARGITTFTNYTSGTLQNNPVLTFGIFKSSTHEGYLRYKAAGYKISDDIFYDAAISTYNISFPSYTRITPSLSGLLNTYIDQIYVFDILLPDKYINLLSFETGITLLANANTNAIRSADITEAKAIRDVYAAKTPLDEIMKNPVLLAMASAIPVVGSLVATALVLGSNAIAADEATRLAAIIATAKAEIIDLSTLSTEITGYIPLVQEDYQDEVHYDSKTGEKIPDPKEPDKPGNILGIAAGIAALILFNS